MLKPVAAQASDVAGVIAEPGEVDEGVGLDGGEGSQGGNGRDGIAQDGAGLAAG